MPKYIIERNVPGAAGLSREELSKLSQRSCAVLRELGPQIAWVQSYVAGDKIYCIYEATSESLVREHARLGGFPADAVTPVARIIDPSTAET